MNLAGLKKLTTHELCVLVSRATDELSSRIAPPRSGTLKGSRPGAALAQRHRIPGDTPERAMQDAIRDAGLAPAIAKAKAKAGRIPRVPTIPDPQRLKCKRCGGVWYREPKMGRPPTTCDPCKGIR